MTLLLSDYYYYCGACGSVVASCATNLKVAGLIPDEVTEFINLPNPSSRNMSSGSTQPLTEIKIRKLLGDKGRPAGMSGNLVSLTYGPLRPVTGIKLRMRYGQSHDSFLIKCL
jgi:hypothetical protein